MVSYDHQECIEVIRALIGLFRNAGGGMIDEMDYCSHLDGCSTMYHAEECFLYPLMLADELETKLNR